MSTLLCWLLTWVITELSKKTKLSQTYVALWLAIIWGTFYYIMFNYYNVEWEKLVQFTVWIYWTSQVVYNLINKFTK